MPNREKQKRKILTLAQMFLEETDEEHYLTVREIAERLHALGIPAERKGVYTDIGELTDAGMDIRLAGGGRENRYYLASRRFSLPELKLLADEIVSSRSVSPAKSRELVGKLSELASRHQRAGLFRGMDASRKSRNEHLYFSVDAAEEALCRRRKLSFRYFEYDLDKRVRYRREGARYVVDPLDLMWSEGNYYLAADTAEHGVTCFRVDRMSEVRAERERAEADPREFDGAAFLRERFGMYGGRGESVELEFDNSLVTAVLDRFGTDVGIRRTGPERFAVLVRVQVSPLFYGWCANFGDRLKILSPPEVAKEYCKTLRHILTRYEK